MAGQGSRVPPDMDRFLPDPSRNPDIDLAYPGYRLATLAALPHSFPVSRVRLADEGFYFRGQRDEMVCYSCRVPYSGWSATDNPAEIHRRLSPHCEYLARRDRQRFAASGLSNGHVEAAGSAQSGAEQSSLVNGARSSLSYPSQACHDPDPMSSLQRARAAATPTPQSAGVSASVAPSSSAPRQEGASNVASGSRPRGRQSVSDSAGSDYRGIISGPAPTSHAAPNTPHPDTSAHQPASVDTPDGLLLAASGGLPRGGTAAASADVRESNNGNRSCSNSPQNRSSTNRRAVPDGEGNSSYRSPLNTSQNTAPVNPGSVADGENRLLSSSSQNRPEQSLTSSSAVESHTANGLSSNSSQSSAPRSREENGEGRRGGGAGHAPLFPRSGLDIGGAVYPMYQDMASRRRTFTEWDDTRAPPLDQLILSGMFYAGYVDCVRCFYCGVGLKHWVPTDDVWTEHVRWRPGCEYLRAIKGDDFIRETQRRIGTENPGNAAQSSNTSAQATTQRQQTTTTVTSTTSAAPTSSQSQTASVTTSTTTARPSAPSCEAARTSASTTERARDTEMDGAARANVAAEAGAAPLGRNSSVQSDSCNRSPSQNGARSVAAEPSVDERQRLNRLREENRRMAQRLQCRVCRNTPIDTILMPCGHLVLCESCAGSVTSCPLCHDPIRATARVHME